jgi:hypothetical protein
MASAAVAVVFFPLRNFGEAMNANGVPMGVIAEQLGHADVKITAKHYAHLSPGYVADTIRAAFGDLGIVPASNLRSMHPATG